MNAFDRHGIKHLSASSLALYRAEPSLWVMSYLYQIRDKDGNAAMWRGTAVEGAVDRLTAGDSIEAATQAALDNFDLNAAGEITEKIVAEREAIPDFVKQAAQAFADKGRPVARQLKIEHFFDGVSVPCIGYVDYLWDNEHLDLKTTLRMPSQAPLNHQIQVAIYTEAKKRPGGLVYVTPKKFSVVPVTDTEEPLRIARQSALAIQALLTKFETREEIAEIFSPSYDGYMWSDTTKNAAREIWK